MWLLQQLETGEITDELLDFLGADSITKNTLISTGMDPDLAELIGLVAFTEGALMDFALVNQTGIFDELNQNQTAQIEMGFQMANAGLNFTLLNETGIFAQAGLDNNQTDMVR